MALATLSIDLEARLARLEGDLGRAAAAVDRSSKRMATSFGAVEKTLVGLRTNLIAAFTATAVAQGIQGIVSGLEKLVDVSEVTGASIENISGLEDVARRTGATIESVETALVKLNGVLKEADGKNAQSQALKAIGLEADALRRLDPAQALLQISVALGQFADDGNKARIVQELFGKSVKEVGPLLKDLAQQGAINATVTADQARAAQQFSDNVAALAKNFLDLSRNLLGPVLQGLNEWIERVKVASKIYGGFLNLFAAGVAPIVDGNAAAASVDAYAQTIKELTRLEAIQEVNRQSASQGIVDRTQKEIDALKKKAELIKVLNKDVALFARPPSDRLRDIEAQSVRPNDFEGIKAPSIQAPKQSNASQISDFEKYIEKLKSAIQSTKDLSAVETLRADVAGGKLKGATNGQIEQLEALASQLDKLKDKDPLGEFIATLESGRAQNDLDEINRLLEQTPTAKREALLRLERLLIEEFDKERISLSKYGEGLDLLQTRFGELAGATEETGKKVSNFADEAARNIQDQLGDTLLRVLEGDFKSIGRAWLNMLNRMVAEAAAAKLNEALFGKSGGLGGLLDFVFGAASTPGDAVFSAASGGKSSATLPVAGKSGGGSQKSGDTFNYNVAAGVSRGEVVSALQLVRDQARADTTMALRRAGVA